MTRRNPRNTRRTARHGGRSAPKPRASGRATGTKRKARGAGAGGRGVPAPKAPTTTPDYAARLARLEALARAKGFDHVLVTNPVDVGYLTGFLGGDSYLVLGAAAGPTKVMIVSDGRYDEELKPQRALAQVVMRTKSLAATVGEVLSGTEVERCGVQGEHLSLAERDAIAGAMRLPGALTPISGLVEQLRVVKDAHEIELMRTAIRIQEAALLAILPTIKPGVSEQEIAASLEAEMKRRGSSKCWFESIVGVGASAALPHYRPGAVRARANEIVLIDWGSTYRGYGGDMTRTFALGKWPAKMREVYEVVREAQEAAAAALAPGRTTHEIDGIARKIIEKAGYGREFNHGLGHGLGMSKEPPFLNPLYPSMELRPGHVCTIEPGVYLPGVGGVRIEDLYVLTESGARNLCTLPKTLAWSTL